MTNQMVPVDQRIVHVRFGGQSWDLTFRLLDLRDDSNDQQVRDAVARYIDVATPKLAPYVVERHTNGNVTIRPEAVFG